MEDGPVLPALMKEADVAKFLGVSRHTMRELRRRRKIHGRKFGRGVFYVVADIRKFIDESRT